MDPLANPVWHALTGPHSTFAEGDGAARRYRPDVTPFAALPDEPSASDWDALAQVLGPGGIGVVLREEVAVPAGWDEAFRIDCYQMVGPQAAPEGHRAEPLTDADVAEMADLVGRTDPGPFRDRTVELGGYVGVRDGGALVAMAGQRLRVPGFTEISAVCTDPAHRGRGLASGLVREVAAQITARGERAFLHVASENTGAIRVYERLDFSRSRVCVAVAVCASST